MNSGVPAAAGQPEGAASDQFFDADVAEETSAQEYTQRLGTADSTSLKEGGFSQVVQDAAENGDLGCLQQVLQQHGVTMLSQRDVDGSTPAHLAAKHGHAECLQFLLQSSVDATSADDSGHTPLHLASQEGRQEVVELLLHSGAPGDTTGTAKQRTPLHLAASNGHTEVCSVLLLQKANATGPQGALLPSAARSLRWGCQSFLRPPPGQASPGEQTNEFDLTRLIPVKHL